MIDKAKLLEAIERYAAARVELAIAAKDNGFEQNEVEHTEYGSALGNLGAVLATLSEPLLDSTVAKAARVLSDRDAARWKFVSEPHWKANKEEAIADARAMLEAIQ